MAPPHGSCTLPEQPTYFCEGCARECDVSAARARGRSRRCPRGRQPTSSPLVHVGVADDRSGSSTSHLVKEDPNWHMLHQGKVVVAALELIVVVWDGLRIEVEGHACA